MAAASGGQFTSVFEVKDAPHLAIGQEGLMTVLDDGATALVQFQVVSREDSAETIIYTMKSNVAPGYAWGFANTRRGIQRVVPDSAIPVGISARGIHAEGRLLDISRGGAGVRVSQEDEAAFCRITCMDLSLALPSALGVRRIAVPSILVNRHQDSTNVRYGFVFDLGMAPHADEITQVITDYVHQRQVVMIRALGNMIDQQL
jgi:hypothetical protein